MESSKSNIKKILGIITFTVLLFWGLHNYVVIFGALNYIFTLLYPFILGGCMAFVLNTPMKAIEKNLKKFGKKEHGVFKDKICRPLSLVLTYILFIGIITLFLFTVLPEIGNTFGSLIVNIQKFFIEAQDTIKQWTNLSIGWLEQFNSLEINWNQIFNFAKKWVTEGAGSFLTSTIGATTAAVGTVVNIALALVFSIYVLLQKEKLSLQCKKILYSFAAKRKADVILSVAQLANKTFSNFLTGQCLEAVILGLLFFVSMSIFRFPYAMLISIMIAFMALIPIFGAFIGCALGMFLIVVVNPIQALWFFVLFIVIQQLEGNLIYPKVVGNSVGLPSIWVLVAVTVGGSTMGIVGMLIFIPLFSVFYSLLRGTVNKRLQDKKIIVR